MEESDDRFKSSNNLPAPRLINFQYTSQNETVVCAGNNQNACWSDEPTFNNRCTRYTFIFIASLLTGVAAMVLTFTLTKGQDPLTSYLIITPCLGCFVLSFTVFFFLCCPRFGAGFHIVLMLVVIPALLFFGFALIIYSLNGFGWWLLDEQIGRPSAGGLGISYLLAALFYAFNLYGVFRVWRGESPSELGLVKGRPSSDDICRGCATGVAVGLTANGGCFCF